VDTADTLSWSGSATGSYGALTVNTNGSYSYVVNAAAVNALQTGSNTTDNFTVTVTDILGATATRTIAMSVVAANDTPVVTNTALVLAGAVTEAGHLDNGQATLFGMDVVNGLTHVTGQLSASDVDVNATQAWRIVNTPSSTYGVMSINATTGLWDFALNNYLTATQALREGDVATQTFTARVTDDFGAYVDQTVTITITGTNDVPVVANDATALVGAVVEVGTNVAGSVSTTGNLDASDVDASATQVWSLVGTPSATYGSMTIDASTGVWMYTLDNSKTATQALAAGQVVTETFTARVTDDKAAFVNQTITVTITGSDDKTVITGTASASLTETDAPLTTGGQLTATDPDSSNAFVAQTDVAGSNGHGKFSISTVGAWTYTANTAHNEFVAGTNYTDTITVATADGTTQVVTVTIAGSNDAAVITGTSTVSLTETNAVLTASGSLSATDVDSAVTFVAQTDAAGSNGHGKFSINAAGEWTYATNNAHDEFLLGTTYTDTLTVATADGSRQVLTVNMAGSYDASYIQGLGTDHVVVFNDGATPTNLDGLPAGTTVTVQGTGTITITAPLGNISVINEGSGTVTVSGAPAGSTLTTGGTGPIVVTTALSAGQTLVVNTNANPNVQIDHSGGGLVEIQGNVALFAGANMAMVLNGNGATVLSETGTVDLRNAPLKLSLASTYRPALGDNITLIANDNGDPVQGTFANLPEGSVVQVGNTSFRLSYQGGTDANDVVLTVVNTPHSGAVSIAGPSTVGSTLVASNSLLDADGIPLLGSGAISYQWLADNVAIPGARAATHVLTDADLAKAVKVIASYTDALGTPESQDSAATMVRAAATTGTEPKAQEALVSSIEVTPTTGNTTVVSLALNTGVNAGLANDSVKVQASSAVTAPSIFEAPLGVFDLTASGTTTGGEKFSLFVDKALAVNGYWVQNAAGVFVNLASPVYGGSTVIEGDKIRLDFTVQDGGQFDSAAVTGTIEASGAAARMELSIVGHTADVPTGGVFF
jgi:VCBS repeat-containing protein